VFDDAFGGYTAGIGRLGEKIERWELLDFLKKARNFLPRYLFTMSTNPYRITSKKPIKHSSLIPSFQISLKSHHRPVLTKN
jgi:hypothetical protein